MNGALFTQYIMINIIKPGRSYLPGFLASGHIALDLIGYFLSAIVQSRTFPALTLINGNG